MKSERRHRSGNMGVALGVLRGVAVGTLRVSGSAARGIDTFISSLYFGKYGGYQGRKVYPSDISTVMERLKRQGYVHLGDGIAGRALKLTSAGRELLAYYDLKGIKVGKQNRWDKKWRVIIFDVHESRKHLRDRIREQLQRWGFYLLQKSVWVYPYECEEMIELLKTAHRARHDILYLTVIDMAQDNKLRKHFGFSLK